MVIGILAEESPSIFSTSQLQRLKEYGFRPKKWLRIVPGKTGEHPTAEHLKRLLHDQSRTLGFQAFGITRPSLTPIIQERLARYLALAYHGSMHWMNKSPRADPSLLWPEAQSVVVVGLSYAPANDPRLQLASTSRGAISVYAQNRDYHDLLKRRLKQLGSWLCQQAGGQIRVFVDTAPVMEKPLAGAAGIGWQGKHTNLVSRTAGSWLFLGEIFTTLQLPVDVPEADRCGSCQRCLQTCPTKAFPAPYQLDARRCISYLTIEHKGPIDRQLRALMGNRIYGCDDCLAVCPWNKFTKPHTEPDLRAQDWLQSRELVELVQLDDTNFRRRFAGSPIKRIGRERFVRNVLIAMGNCGTREHTSVVEALLEDTSALVRATAVWTLSCLLSRSSFELLRSRYLTGEQDASVIEEWLLAVPEARVQ